MCMSRKMIVLVCLAVLGAGRLLAQGIATDTTHSLTITTNPAGKLHMVQSTATFTPGAAIFGSYGTAVTVQYYARTSAGGTITAKSISDFATCGAPATAPSVACNAVKYTCAAVTFGTGCASTQTLSTTTSTSVVSLPPSSGCTNGGSPCGPANPSGISLTFTLTNDPNYKTGTYSAIVQFTISAT